MKKHPLADMPEASGSHVVLCGETIDCWRFSEVGSTTYVFQSARNMDVRAMLTLSMLCGPEDLEATEYVSLTTVSCDHAPAVFNAGNVNAEIPTINGLKFSHKRAIVSLEHHFESPELGRILTDFLTYGPSNQRKPLRKENVFRMFLDSMAEAQLMSTQAKESAVETRKKAGSRQKRARCCAISRF